VKWLFFGVTFCAKAVDKKGPCLVKQSDNKKHNWFTHKQEAHMYSSVIATRLRTKIAQFSGELSAGLGKVASRFVSEMIYGIQASQSVVLTKIARVLEENIEMKKTHERLCRNLGNDQLGQALLHNLLSISKKHIDKDTLLALDPSDLSKKYAEKMEYLCQVHDGSEGGVADGYPLMHVIGCEIDSKEIVPLYQRLYSYTAPEFKSENDEILKAVDMVRKHVGPRRGIWVIDRGADRAKLYQRLLERKARFIIRMVGNRHLLVGKRKRLAIDIASDCPTPYAEAIVKMEHGQEKRYTISFGFRKVKLPDCKQQLYMLVVKGFGKKPLMILTTEKLRRSYKVLYKILRSYLKRWSIEETIRFIKDSYDLEDVRVLRYRGLQNLMPLVLAVIYFSALVLDGSEKLKILVGHVLKAAKRVFGIPDFKYYALSDGLKKLFALHPGKPHFVRKKPPDPQLLLFEP
jgi:hypothetical protein